MILDPDNKYIQAINTHIPLPGATILEIGCGDGRLTRDIARYAAKVVATDLNLEVLEQAKKNISAKNVDFLYTPDGTPKLLPDSFDMIIYTLSLHHIPTDKMIDNLYHSSKLLKKKEQSLLLNRGEAALFRRLKNALGREAAMKAWK
ncbi:MAG: class I SAM-dependent methyltransferase [Desulfuromusa sp.]|jgi:2-polyprenyl-3-methyl-5-hydroxy-6-metoxy-1,4-benzoquinol methylase|nr:class I SAM-dependent methyltransferase [Desulfuromusa sp.]